MKPYFEVFTDSASRNNNKVGVTTLSSSASIIVFNKKPIKYKATHNTNSTNNNGELNAILVGIKSTIKIMESLKSMKGKYPFDIFVYSDSGFCINGLNKWYKTWIKCVDSDGDWLNSSGKKVANQDIFKKILVYVNDDRYNIRFIYVPGHVGEKRDKTYEIAIQKFNNINGFEIDMDTFKYLVDMNKKVDLLANKVLDEGTDLEGNVISGDLLTILTA